MPSSTRKTLRMDYAVIAAAGCLIVGYLLGLATGQLIQGSPPPTPGPVATPQPAIAPPSSALGNLSAEIREMEKIVAEDPDNAAAWVRLGNLYFDTDQYVQAIDAYTRGLELRPGDPNVLTDRGIMYRRIGDFQQAVADFRRAAELDPTHLNSSLNLGVVLRYDLEDIPGAIQAWQMYLNRNPPPEMAEKIRREIETLRGQQ